MIKKKQQYVLNLQRKSDNSNMYKNICQKKKELWNWVQI
jgi:hypothetical protein